MLRGKKCLMYDGMYRGTYSNERIQQILHVLDMTEIRSLRGCIYDVPRDVFNAADKIGMGVKEYLEAQGRGIEMYQGILRDYQTKGVAFMYLSPHSILGDSVGKGKTVEIAGLLNVLRRSGELSRFMVAVETMAQEQTRVELARKTGMTVLSLQSETPKLERQLDEVNWDKVDGVVLRHSTLKNNVFQSWLARSIETDGTRDYSNLFNVLIIDESTVVKNRDSRQYNYTVELCRLMPRIHLLSATALELSILDVYNQLDLIDPNVLPAVSNIKAKYCVYDTDSTYWKRDKVTGKAQQYSRWDMIGYKNQDEFKRATRLFYYGKTNEGNTHRYKIEWVYPTELQKLALSAKVNYGKALNNPDENDIMQIPFDEANLPKYRRLIELMTTEFADKKTLIYCFYVQAQDKISQALKAKGLNVRILNGFTKEDERVEIIERFNYGDCDVIITNVKRSLNLFAGEACIFYTVETNPAKMEQIRGRIDRHVDDTVKEFRLMVYKGTPEEEKLMSVIPERSKDARELAIASMSAIDYFVESLGEEA